MEEQEDVPGITMLLVDFEVVVEHMVMVEDQVVEAGGYSGGASRDNVNGSCGGRGGSYNVGKNQVNKSAFNNKGDGYVFVTLYVN